MKNSDRRSSVDKAETRDTANSKMDEEKCAQTPTSIPQLATKSPEDEEQRIGGRRNSDEGYPNHIPATSPITPVPSPGSSFNPKLTAFSVDNLSRSDAKHHQPQNLAATYCETVPTYSTSNGFTTETSSRVQLVRHGDVDLSTRCSLPGKYANSQITRETAGFESMDTSTWIHFTSEHRSDSTADIMRSFQRDPYPSGGYRAKSTNVNDLVLDNGTVLGCCE